MKIIPEGFRLIPEHIEKTLSGQCEPLFLRADSARSALSEAERNRLVKNSKSPTGEKLQKELLARTQFFEKSAAQSAQSWLELEPVAKAEIEHERIKTPKNATGAKAVVEYREWQEAWRVRTEAECTSGSKPPEQSSRESEMLTARGATKIAESCEYMHLKKGGFQTFVTGTFGGEARARIDSGESTIQKEVTRTMDALQKMYQRGWNRADGKRVAGHEGGLPYLWVVEVPENDKGEPNPHIHMLMGWQVEYHDFRDWAARIERLWGNGYFHLEKIKDSQCAGAYMAKAAGYMTKAQGCESQGLVKGNRYGISATARAPAWVVLSYDQIHTMGQLIYDVYDHLTVQYGEKYRERKALNNALTNLPKEAKASRKKIGERLARIRAEINSIPIRANRYQVVVTGKAAAVSFFNWLETPTGEGSVTETWLPEKLDGWHWEKGPKASQKYNQFNTKVRCWFETRRFWRRLKVPSWMQEHHTNEYWHCVKHEYDFEAYAEEIEDYGYAQA